MPRVDRKRIPLRRVAQVDRTSGIPRVQEQVQVRERHREREQVHNLGVLEDNLGAHSRKVVEDSLGDNLEALDLGALGDSLEERIRKVLGDNRRVLGDSLEGAFDLGVRTLG